MVLPSLQAERHAMAGRRQLQLPRVVPAVRDNDTRLEGRAIDGGIDIDEDALLVTAAEDEEATAAVDEYGVPLNLDSSEGEASSDDDDVTGVSAVP